MKRSTKDDQEQRSDALLQRSPVARKIVEARPWIEGRLRAHPRRVWPFAKVARLFGISTSLLRKWVDQGLLVRFRPPTEHHRPGLTERAIRKFMRGLADAEEWGVPGAPERPRPAEEKCLEVMRLLPPKEILTPAEFAARAGVGVTTVHRMLASGCLTAWYPTPHRPKICDRYEKERRNRLTRKQPKKGR